MSRTHTIATLTCAAGLAISAAAVAQSDRSMMPPTRDGQRYQETAQRPMESARGYTFMSCQKLDGMTVVGPDSKSIGEVSNVVFDRLTGRIEALAVDLGLLSKTVSVPFSQFSWDTTQDDGARLALSMTEEQLKAMPAFDKGRLESYQPSNRADTGNNLGDPFPSNQAASATASGTIERIEVLEMPNGDEYTVAVLSNGSSPRRVALGPSWYTRGATYVPFRGAKVNVKGYEIERNGQPLFVATEITDAKGGTATYRDQTGKPHWERTASNTPESYRSRYMLLSALDGRDVQAHAQSCGSVHDVIIERGGGQIAFLSIDPNENFLGIADTKRLVPFSLAVIPAEGPAQIDASKEMVVASIETPDDVTTLSGTDRLTAAYRAFGVETPRYRTHASQPMGKNSDTDLSNTGAWQRIGSSIKATDDAARVRVSGTVESIETRTLGEGIGQVRVLRLNDSGKTYEVIVGPPAYLARQKAVLASGNRVDLSLTPMRIDSREYWIANSYQTSDGNVVLWDDTGRPAWNSSR